MKTNETPVDTKPKMTTVETKIEKDPAKRQGLRGLKGFAFERFAQEVEKSKGDLSVLKTPEFREKMLKEIVARYPQSKWVSTPERTKIHHSYYVSKFISARQNEEKK